MASKTSEALKHAGELIALTGDRNSLFEQAQRCWGELLQGGASASDMSKFNQLVQDRLISVDEMTPTDLPTPIIENGHYVTPTPRLGERVLWYQNNKNELVIAADVVRIEGAGRVELRLIKAQNDATSVNQHVLGVRHRSNPIHLKPSNPTTVKNGSWDYLPGEPISDSHYDVARKEIFRRQDAKRRSEMERLVREQAIQKQEELARSLEPQEV